MLLYRDGTVCTARTRWGWSSLVTGRLAIAARHLRSPQRVPPQNSLHRHSCCDVHLAEVSHGCVVTCGMGIMYPIHSCCCGNCIASSNNVLSTLLSTLHIKSTVCWRENRKPMATEKGQAQLVWPWPCGLWLSEAGGCSEKRRRVWSGVQRGPGQRRRQMLLGLLLLQATAGRALWWESTSWSVQSGWPLEPPRKHL